MEKIVVNDTNVFIDLFNVDLLEEFFSLPWEVYTTDFVMLELQREGQQTSVSNFVNTGQLNIPVFEPNELLEIGNIFQRYGSSTNLSYTDCSVWYYAKRNNYVLLTGDRKLRSASVYEGVEVHGIIYVLDQLLAEGVISYQSAIEKIQLLYATNPRLPKEEIDKRLDFWKSEIAKKGGCQ